MPKIGLVKEIGIRGCVTTHPTDKELTIVSNGADHFICEIPRGHDVLHNMPVLRKATEEESNFYRRVATA